jgi:hypothetical protein
MLPRPIIALLALTIGLPFLVLFAVVSSAAGAEVQIFSTVLQGTVLGTFLILMIFEIKRLVDQSPDGH